MPIKKTLINVANKAAKSLNNRANNGAPESDAQKAARKTGSAAVTVASQLPFIKLYVIAAIIIVVALVVGAVVSVVASTMTSFSQRAEECAPSTDEGIFGWFEEAGQALSEEDQESLRNTLGSTCKKVGTGFDGLAYPPAAGYISAQFGQDRGASSHRGMDIADPCHTPIYAFAGGEVTKVVMGTEAASGGGQYVYPMGEIVIEHTGTFRTRYLHMQGSSTTVKKGDIVSAGQQIATTWTNGPSTGCHLHIEAWENNVPVDMNKFLKACGWEYSENMSQRFTDFPPEPVNCGPGGDGGAGDIKTYAKEQMKVLTGVSASDTEREFQCLDNLWKRESSWKHTALNPAFAPSQPGAPEYQAYGIPQSGPGKKMESEGADWKTNPQTQVRWGLKYIKGRYGTPCGAWAHSEAHNWY